MNNPSVVVIGAGVMGLGLTWSLLKEGAEVTVVGSTNADEEIGWASVAWSNASSKVRRQYPAHYTALNSRGVDAAVELAEEIGGGWLHPTGTVQIVSGDEAGAKLAEDVNRLNAEFSYPAELLTAKDTGALTEQALDEAQKELNALYGADHGRMMYEQEMMC